MILDIPRTIEQFRIHAHVGSGGMADVYLAYREQKTSEDQEFVVIKILKDKYRDESELAVMFVDEVKILRRMSHPNVVKYLGNGEIHNRPYIIMEYLSGDNLGVLAKAARSIDDQLSISLITRICIQTANALDYVHKLKDEQGADLRMVHRDISPQNILVTYDGRIKLLDFGVAWTEDRSIVTRTGVLKGKLRYMSPEQIESRHVDARSDLFSLGIVMWELLSNKKLFKADNEYQTMKMICEGPIPSLEKFRDDLPVSLEAIVMGLLRRSVEERYQSAAQLRSSLMNFLRQGCPDSHPDEIAREAGRLLSKRKALKDKAIRSISPENGLEEFLFADMKQQGQISTSSFIQKSINGTGNVIQGSGGRTTDALGVKSQTGPKKKPFAWFGAGLGISLMLVFIAGLLMANREDGSVAKTPAHKPASTQPDAGSEPGIQNSIDAGVTPGESAPSDSVFGSQAPDKHLAAGDEAAGVDADDHTSDQTTRQTDERTKDTAKVDLGFLIVKTTPKTRVYVGKEYIGETPVTDMRLKPGKYQITMVNKKAGIEKKVRVVIHPQEVSSLQYMF